MSTPLSLFQPGKRRIPRLGSDLAVSFIIRNGQMRPEWQEVNPQTLTIMPLALATLIKNQSVGDLYRLYHEAGRVGFDYHLAIIPDDFREQKREKFDTAYMNQLFSLGYEKARQGYPWAKKPPRW